MWIVFVNLCRANTVSVVGETGSLNWANDSLGKPLSSAANRLTRLVCLLSLSADLDRPLLSSTEMASILTGFCSLDCRVHMVQLGRVMKPILTQLALIYCPFLARIVIGFCQSRYSSVMKKSSQSCQNRNHTPRAASSGALTAFITGHRTAPFGTSVVSPSLDLRNRNRSPPFGFAGDPQSQSTS